ncbi:MAG: hypothetical protein M2R45_01184 [Verrucomicrobia subdivision 3 bacterium]|nr:hypothetical protein [Limisphaerales bacterium]MCS1415263.1 hypothetical protein [Limisphaerales bacterium]
MVNPHQTEGSANHALGRLLARVMPGRQTQAECTNMIAGANNAGLRPDIIITASGRAPVIIEAEYLPAQGVEREAVDRIGLKVSDEPHPIEAVIALRYPEAIAEADDLEAALGSCRLSYCVRYADQTRFPKSGWLEGSVSDLADLVDIVAVPEGAIDEATEILKSAIESAVSVVTNERENRPGIIQNIAEMLEMTDLLHARRMACCMMANALIFQNRLVGIHKKEGIRPPSMICGKGASNLQSETIEEWTKILEINYWPIFAVSKDILGVFPPSMAAPILRRLTRAAEKIEECGMTYAHDVTGKFFQRLTADRKYLAAFYTLPQSASLLARLAIAKMRDVVWSDPDAIGRLRVADFACGTGALLSAVYGQMACRHERASGKASALHQAMMENVLWGFDILPSAVHITSSTLSGVQPDVGYDQSRLYKMDSGRDDDGNVKIGSLELLDTSEQSLMKLNLSDPARRISSGGEKGAGHITVDVRNESYDLVIMNPPFTRATNHEGKHINVVNPAFAAFNAKPDEQTAMGARLNNLGKKTCYHGNAGIASAFAAIADKKLKPGGVLALVLPLSVAGGLSWQKLRALLAESYTDVEVVSIAANGGDMSFSDETGMAECLIVGRKLNPDEPPDHKIRFTSLLRRPAGFVQAAEIAKELIVADSIRDVADGPFGGTPVFCGGEKMGETITATVHETSPTWNPVRIRDYSLAQTAHALTQGKLWLPGEPKALELKTMPVGEIGKLGLVHRDITGTPNRGPFKKMPPSRTATYPALWNHNAKAETRIICEPDSQLQVRIGMESKAPAVWKTRSRAHLNSDFRFNSQPLAVAFTETKSLGGTAWPNVRFRKAGFDYTFAVWGNSTLGLLSQWWHANLQQTGRGRITIRSAETLSVLDFRALSDEQLKIAQDIFEDFRRRDLKPAYQADTDPNREHLDRRILCDCLGLGESTFEAVRRLAVKWCAEPSVHGGKAKIKHPA